MTSGWVVVVSVVVVVVVVLVLVLVVLVKEVVKEVVIWSGPAVGGRSHGTPARGQQLRSP